MGRRKSTKITNFSNKKAQRGRPSVSRTHRSNVKSVKKNEAEKLIEEDDKKQKKGKFGSYYHYKISYNDKKDQKELQQVRASARLSKKKN